MEILSKDQWSNWLRDRLEERKRVFLSDPDELIASFNREKSLARDYRGRELIELIQNADDSGIDDSGINYSETTSLLIKLTNSALFIANTGTPFSPEGIKSLLLSDNSPKQFLRAKCIGYKGLGFRSILGWASSIVILSGNLSIGFNEKLAVKWLHDLKKQNPKVDEKVKKIEGLGFPAPIATLSVPISAEGLHQNMELNSIYEEGAKILESGYDTVICLLFKNAEKTREQVQKQINSLRNEIMLFLQFLEKVEIQSPERNECWIVERSENEIIVNPDSAVPEIWEIFKREGRIPSEYLKPEQILHDNYEIKLAIPTRVVDINRLFVFFPTEVRLPFPIIVHATFEVGDNRQHLIDSDVNRFISQELADLMAESAEKIKDIKNPWYALSTISPRGDIDPILEKFNFLEMLRECIKKYKIIPVRNGLFLTVADSKRIRGNFDNLLKGELFHDLCTYIEDHFIKKQLDDLGIDYIEYEDLKNRLDKLSNGITLDERADIILLLIENNLIDGEPPELLIDENAERILSYNSVFLPPEGKTFTLPSWVPQRILNTELTSLLKAKFKISRVRGLAENLKSFNIQEYNLNALISAIQAETNRRCKEKPDDELSLRQRAIKAMWGLYSSSEEKGKLRDEITVILPTRNDNFESAKKLYFGKEYRNGKILEYLYGHINPNSFIASPAKLGISDVSRDIEDFLCWIGVNKNLRYVITNGTNKFLEYVMFAIKYPAKFNEITVENIEDIRGYNCNKILRNVMNVDELEQILATADPHAILCWIATNPDIELWRIERDKNAIFEIRFPYQQYHRRLSNSSVPSYPLWLLGNTQWLTIEGDDKLSPNKCCLAPGAKNISPIVGYPAIDMEHSLIKELNLDHTAVKNALIKIGVVTDLDELPWDSFYEILLELPKLDPEGNNAKSIYRKLFSRSDAGIDPSGKAYQEFMTEGKMLGRKKGEVKYYPIKELYYLQNITLPNKIQEQYPLLEIDRRSGASKVKKLFGVEQLTRDNIQIEITRYEEHPCMQNFQSEVDRIKPYIYALRLEGDANRAELNALRRLNVILCKTVSVAMVVDEEKQEIELQKGDSISIDSKAYLVADPDYTSPFLLEDPEIADSVGEIVSNILKVDMTDQTARILTCPSNKRNLILDRMVGGSGEEKLTRSKELFTGSADKEPTFSKPLPWQPPISNVTTTTEERQEMQVTTAQQVPVGEVLVTDRGVMTPSSKKIIVRKLQSNPKTSTSSRSKKRADPDRSEDLAMKFEEAENRYPMKISHIRGLESYGCDIISFKSESDMNSFETNNNPDFIERFIEVKGSASEKGSITLKGNQLRSAQKNKEKFFIYRIYEDENNGNCELIEINNPLDCEKDALEAQYEINPFRSVRARIWGIEEKENNEVSEKSNMVIALDQIQDTVQG